MKSFVLSGALLLLTTIFANADARFQGDFFITGLTAGCAGQGYSVGDYARARFRPAKVDGNNNSTGFGVHFGRYTNGYWIKGALSKKYKNATAGGIATGPFSWTGSKIRYSELTPSKITASTDKILMTVVISKYDGIANCTATFSGAVTKRP